MREIRSGGSFLSQNDLRAYFGLGDYAGPVDVAIRMPGGRRWEWKQLPTDRLHVLTLSESAAIPKDLARAMKFRFASSRRVLVALVVRRADCAGGRRTTAPSLPCPESMQPFLKHLEPGDDGFPLEGQAKELEAGSRSCRRRFAEQLRAHRRRHKSACSIRVSAGRVFCLPKDRLGARRALDVQRAKDLPKETDLDARAFGAELQRLVQDLRDVTVAEFLITAIDGDRVESPHHRPLRHRRRRTKTYRVEHVGEWEMNWRRNASGWQVVRWTATSHVVSRARQPIFNEITEAALGRNDSFRRQLTIDLDSWMATFDSVLTRDSNGHHGVSVGDADGDGLDDLYVAQPAGLPNRLYRNRGDSTFEDITDSAGVGVLDDTAQSLFADVDNDGDQDLGRRDVDRPAALRQRRQGALHARGGRLQVRAAVSGRADVDRDGGLRPGRLSRSVRVRLLVSLRRRRGQGRHAGAVLRRAQRTAERALSK